MSDEFIHEKNPVDKLWFWRARVYKTLALGKMLHQVILDDSLELWQYTQSMWSTILLNTIPRGSRVLDAGCGYGALWSAFEEALPPGGDEEDRLCHHVEYVGVDFSPDLIELANIRYPQTPQRRFLVADLADLWMFPDKHFDWVVARSVASMVESNVGVGPWLNMAREVTRVGRNLLVGDYPSKPRGHIPYGVQRDV